MENLVKWFKEKWILILGTFGVVVVTLGAIFGRKKVDEDKTVELHENRTTALAAAQQIEAAAQESMLKVESEATVELATIEQKKQEEIKTLESKEQRELTSALAEKFNFKNGDKL